MSKDPLDALTLRAYGYASDNPTNTIDPNGLWTVQVGLPSFIANIGPLGVVGSVGLVLDGHGNFGVYEMLGGGLGAGAEATAGVSGDYSTAECASDLAGYFVQTTVALGGGFGGAVDGFYAKGSNGRQIVGGGLTGGGGVGAGGFSGVTLTRVQTVNLGDIGRAIHDFMFRPFNLRRAGV